MIPFDPIKRSYEMEEIVMLEDARRYYRFRYAGYYGGVCTGDATGCNLLCAYCWNYFRNENPNLGIKDLGYLTPRVVARRFKAMGKNHSCNKFRISGCEPFLGEASTQHLAAIIKSMPSSNFIVESNGLMLGFNPALIGHLSRLDNVLIRVAVKADNPKTFEQVTGAKGEFQPFQITAIKELRAEGINVSVAYMDQFLDPNLLGLGSDEDFDNEGLRYYKSTKARLRERGLLEQVPKPFKAVFKTQKPKESLIKHESPYWEDKGDIT